MAEQKVPVGAQYEILKFLYRWKLVTTKALPKRFFPMVMPITGYQHLLEMRDRWKCIEWACDPMGRSWAWTLTQQGFRWLRKLDLDAAENGFRSEHYAHDLLVSAVHIGDWLAEKRNDENLFSEQELRRYPLEQYPDWVPKSKDHRSDGYWRIIRDGDVSGAVALEVELSLKSADEYVDIGRFYETHKDKLFRVVWIVKDLRKAKRIQQGLTKYAFGEKRDYHAFFLLPDFFFSGWEAKIVLGRENDLGKSLDRMINGPKPDQISYKKVCTEILLEQHKSPKPSTTPMSYSSRLYLC